MYECAVIGGGVGGLTAAIYLARFHFKTCVIDNEDSRAALIPLSHNFPGFPDGIAGKDILLRLRKQYQCYQQDILTDTVLSIKKDKSSAFFLIKTHHTLLQAKHIVLATGVIDIEPSLPNVDSSIKKGLSGWRYRSRLKSNVYGCSARSTGCRLYF
jgi:thioredoxin reductase (NADPH)